MRPIRSLSSTVFAVSSLAWAAFFVVLLIDDRRDRKVLIVALFVVGFPSQLALLFGMRDSTRRPVSMRGWRSRAKSSRL